MLVSKPTSQQPPTRTFVDLDSFSVSGLASVPSPSMTPSPTSSSTPASRTHAFFATTFSSRPPSPKIPSRAPSTALEPAAAPQAVRPPRSRTADFFSNNTPFGSLSNGSSQSSSSTSKPFHTTIKPQAPSLPSKPRRSFLHLDILPSFQRSPALDSTEATNRHEESISPVLPTPTNHHRQDIPSTPSAMPDTSSEPTPRPPAITMNLSHPLPASPSILSKESPLSGRPAVEADMGGREDADVVMVDNPDSALPDVHNRESSSENTEELAAGMVIRSRSVLSRSGSENHHHVSSSSPGPTTSSTSISEPSPVALRLTKPLGMGTFSSVWLAQDLSPTPLLVKSRQSLKDLRRRAASTSSLQSSDSDQNNTGKLQSARSSSSIIRRLRGGVSGTRPGGGSGSEHLSRESSLNEAKQWIPGQGWQGSEGAGFPKRRRNVSGASDFSDDRETESRGVMPSFTASLSDNSNLSVAPAHTALSRSSSVSWRSSVSSDGEGEQVVQDESYIRSMQNRYEERKNRRRLVAVKMTLRGIIEADKSNMRGDLTAYEARERDRTRVGFVREVEVLRHISHPNITPLLSHLTTKTHHVLVMPYLPGGDLLGLVNSESWNSLDEETLRRIFSELCKAVAWMHGVGLVHRDVKLENILLTVPLLESGLLIDCLPPMSTPLIKLTDFGLSRFIDPTDPLLTTRCGSEAYAAPELVISGGRKGVASTSIIWGDPSTASGEIANKNGGYDARETDAWACGVVLYGLVARKLPFGEGPGQAFVETGIRGETGRAAGYVTVTERRQWLMKIARGDWIWPESSLSSPYDDKPDSAIIRGTQLPRSVGARGVAEKLLVRDPSRRARVVDVLSDEWMDLSRDLLDVDFGHEVFVTPPDPPGSPGVREEHIYIRDDLPGSEYDDEDEDEDDAVDHDGWLVDKDSIHSIARQEVQ